MPNDQNVSGTILLVDDVDQNIRTILGILDQYDIIPCTSGKEALQILGEESVDLILLDIMMPEMNGFEVCEQVRANPKTAEIPIIFLTARQDEDSIEKAYDLGGHDYVTKPFLPKELKARVAFQLKFNAALHTLEYLASHDQMTGIFNRRRFFEIAKTLFDKTPPEQLFTIMLDIDHFKHINDQYGHAVGDITLKEITKVITKVLPPKACFARLGGEEFAVILTTKDISEINDIAESIRINVEKAKIISGANVIHCSISLGICQNSLAIKDIDELLHSADEALYEAKNGGRNRSIFRGSTPIPKDI